LAILASGEGGMAGQTGFWVIRGSLAAISELLLHLKLLSSDRQYHPFPSPISSKRHLPP
jgi:hypothetical protein